MSDRENNVNTSESSAQDQLLADILARFAQNSTPQPPPAPQSASSTAPSSDILSSLLSNKDLMSKLPQMISAVKPILEFMGNQSAKTPEQVERSASNSPPAYPAAAARSKSEAERSALLCAMKPYLSRDRQNAIDYIIKLSRLGDILKTL